VVDAIRATGTLTAALAALTWLAQRCWGIRGRVAGIGSARGRSTVRTPARAGCAAPARSATRADAPTRAQRTAARTTVANVATIATAASGRHAREILVARARAREGEKRRGEHGGLSFHGPELATEAKRHASRLASIRDQLAVQPRCAPSLSRQLCRG
jgi:hypothetical protein